MRWSLLLLLSASACITPRASQTWESAMAQGQVAFNEGAFGGAITKFKEASEANRWDKEAWLWLGMSYFAAGKLDLAEAPLRRALTAADGEYPTARMNLGTLYLAQQRWPEAETELKAVLENPEYREPERARNNLGWVYLQQGRLEEARTAFREVLRQFPMFCPGLRNLAAVDESEDQFQDALVRLQQAMQCDPTDLSTRLALGRVAAHLDLVGEACEQLGTVRRADSFGGLSDEAGALLATLDCDKLGR